ncbi:hypothetical protein DJ013_14195 [Arcticibacterium luteifluviistationis]|uniref:Outer membrane protein beta-barrel domain-containing protein n=2 Tax=Arcticibacterium luteifluviistationis TaxID=1784714 RepID=A0A2Z4GEI8_9BACT|nr:hypothetical protein DJ013_14195 [Arcticibacterium luteifluviistationis]
MVNIDPTIQFQAEYFLNSENSFQLSYGFGAPDVFDQNKYIKADIFRIEYKRYYKTIDMDNPWGTYFGGELFYKNVLYPQTAVKTEESPSKKPQTDDYTVNINVTAFHLKYGKTFIKKGIPTFDFFIGAGVRYQYNFNQDLEAGYEFIYHTSFNRIAQKGIYPSATLGISLGMNGWSRYP